METLGEAPCTGDLALAGLQDCGSNALDVGVAMTDRSVGVHALVWVGSWGETNARRAMEGARRCGYNRLEIPLLDTWDLDLKLTGRLLKEEGLAMTGNMFLTSATDITSDDPDAVAAGEQRLMGGVDTVAEVGGSHLCGTIYSMLGRYDHPPTARGREQCAAVLQRVADHAAQSGVRLTRATPPHIITEV